MMHKKASKQFAEDKQTKDMDYWNHVLWSDETKINLCGSDGVKRVWWQPDEEYKDKCVLPTVKHGDGSVMVWHCISEELQFIEGTINANMYGDILKQSMIPSLRRLGRRAVFQHNNDHCLAKEAEGKGDGLAKQCWKIKMWGVYSLLWDAVCICVCIYIYIYIYILVKITKQYIVSKYPGPQNQS